MQGLSPVVENVGLLLLQSMDPRALGSLVMASRLPLHGMWNLPGSGIEPMSPTLAGGFFFFFFFLNFTKLY